MVVALTFVPSVCSSVRRDAGRLRLFTRASLHFGALRRYCAAFEHSLSRMPRFLYPAKTLHGQPMRSILKFSIVFSLALRFHIASTRHGRLDALPYACHHISCKPSTVRRVRACYFCAPSASDDLAASLVLSPSASVADSRTRQVPTRFVFMGEPLITRLVTTCPQCGLDRTRALFGWLRVARGTRRRLPRLIDELSERASVSIAEGSCHHLC